MKLSRTQLAALKQISTPATGPAPYRLCVKERTALVLIRLGLAKNVGEYINHASGTSYIQLVPTEAGLEASRG